MNKALAHLALVLIAALAGCAAHAQALPEQDRQQGPVQDDQNSPPSPEAVALLEEIEAASAKLDTLEARVRYTRVQGLTGDIQKRFGDFYYHAPTDKHPTRFAVRFDRLVVDEKARPMQTWYIFDGNWLLERDHDDKQATRRELVPEGAERDGELSLGDGRLPIPLRLKADTILKRYHVTRLPEEESEKRLCHPLRLVPRDAGEDDAPLMLWFDHDTLLLYKLETEQDGDTIELVLPTPKANAEIKDGVFDTTLPDPDEGWQVQEVPLER